MGISTTCDVVPFKISSCFGIDLDHMNGYNRSDFPNMTDILWGHLESFVPNDEGKGKGTLVGWSWDFEDFARVGKHERIYAEAFRKGDYVVYRLNESEYEMVNGVDLTFVANNKESLIEFCKDVGVDPESIEENEAVSQTS